MSWNLESHILDHAEKIINNLKPTFDPNNPKNQHFTLSCDLSQLIVNHQAKNQKDIDLIMSNFMSDLAAHTHTFKESKGKRNGTQIFREKEIHFRDALMAYHNSGSDSINSQNYEVLPHLHLLFDKSQKLGIGYYQLRNAIEEVSLKHNIVFNFQEEIKEKDNSLKLKVSSFSWSLKRSSDIDFLKKIANKGLDNDLQNIKQHYQNTGNLQYYIKVMRDLQARLKRLDVDYNFCGKNLKEEFPLFLNEKQKNDIRILHLGQDKKEIYRIISDRDNLIGRAFLENNQGFKNIIIDELQKRGATFFKLNDIDFERINLKINRKEKKSNDYQKSINFCYKEDFLKAVGKSKNEKEVQELLKSMGYKDFQYKQKTINKKRSKVGFTFINQNGKVVTAYFSNLGIDLKEIRKDLKKNKESGKEFDRDNIESNLKNYKPKKSKKNTDIFEEIYKFTPSHDVSSYYICETFETVQMYKKGVFIEDQGNRIETKAKSENMEESVAIILDIAESKKWDLDNLIIDGSQDFKNKIAAEIEKRKTAKDIELEENQEINSTVPADIELSQELQKQTMRDIEKESNKGLGL